VSDGGLCGAPVVLEP